MGVHADQAAMADLISVRKVPIDSQVKMCCSNTEKKKHPRLELKSICKRIRPNYKCSYKIVKITRIDQKKVLTSERFRWIRRVKFILDEVSGVYVYDAHVKVNVADVTNSNFQEILEYDSDEIDEDVCVETTIIDDSGDEKAKTEEDKEPTKNIASPIRGSIDDYLKFNANMNQNNTLVKLGVEVEDDPNSLDTVKEDIELL